MRRLFSIFLFIAIVSLGLTATGRQIVSPQATLNVSGGAVTTALSGCTVSVTNTINYGANGCPANLAAVQAITGGATWSVAAIQGFDNGANLGTGQVLDSTAAIDCTGKYSHTGNCATTVLIAHNSDSNRWYFGPIIGREYYLSYYDNCNGCVFNEEYTLNHVKLQGLPTSNCGSVQYPESLSGCNGQEEFSQTWVGSDPYTGPQGGTAFNSIGTKDEFGPQGNYEVAPQHGYGPAYSGYGSGGWHQLQIWVRSNTSNNTDGYLRIWIDGASYWDLEGINITGSVDMSGMTVDAGGYYTKNNWVVCTSPFASAVSIENTQPSNEGVVGQGCGVEPTGCAIFTACAAGQNVPETKRASDDIILLER